MGFEGIVDEQEERIFKATVDAGCFGIVRVGEVGMAMIHQVSLEDGFSRGV